MQTHKCDGVARYFDAVFAIGFASLAVLYLIWILDKGGSTLTDYVLIGYYAFFSAFMFGCMFRLEVIFLNFGFLNNVLLKSVFYIL